MDDQMIVCLSYADFADRVRNPSIPAIYGFSEELMRHAYNWYIAKVNKINVFPGSFEEKQDKHSMFLDLMMLRNRSYIKESVALEEQAVYMKLVNGLDFEVKVLE